MPLEYRRVFRVSAFIYGSNMYSCTQTLYHRTGACFILCQLFQASDGMPPPHCYCFSAKEWFIPLMVVIIFDKTVKNKQFVFSFCAKDKSRSKCEVSWGTWLARQTEANWSGEVKSHHLSPMRFETAPGRNPLLVTNLSSVMVPPA